LLPELRAWAEQRPLLLKAQGARTYDVDNVGLLDYTAAGGSVIVGYGNQFVLDAVRRVLATGVPDGHRVPGEVDLAEALRQALPWVRTWWMCRDEDVARAATLWWARQTTSRDVVLVLDGGDAVVHGTAPAVDRDDRLVPVTGWDPAGVADAMERRPGGVAALVVDPLMSRLGLIPPPPNVMPALEDVCRQHGALLVFDERVSGFRVARGGASAWLGVTPDAAILGGALGGGFPLGVVAFSRPSEDVADAVGVGLPPPHPVSLAAAEAVLSILKNESTYERLEDRAEQLVGGVLALAERFARPMTANRVGSAFALYMSSSPVRDQAGVEGSDLDAYRSFARDLRTEGVLVPASPMEPAFVSNAHGAKDIEETLAACERVLKQASQEESP